MLPDPDPDPDLVPELERRNCLASPATTESSSAQARHEEEPTRPFGIGNGIGIGNGWESALDSHQT
jgi:hypothetical protein